MNHGIYEALVLGIGSLLIFVSADDKTDCIWVGIGRVMHKIRPKTMCMWAGAVMNQAGYMVVQSRMIERGSNAKTACNSTRPDTRLPQSRAGE